MTSLDSKQLISLAKQLNNTPVFNLADESDDLRHKCIANILHITPSNKMKSDALKQLEIKKPDSKANAQAWHYSFVKFAARDLNKRFKKNYSRSLFLDETKLFSVDNCPYSRPKNKAKRAPPIGAVITCPAKLLYKKMK